MITPFDETYLETKRILLGEARLKPEFAPLAGWIDQTFGVRTLNILYDTMESGKRPRLEICFEFGTAKAAFYDPLTSLYDREKQKAIAEKFKESIREQNLSGRYLTEDVWVIFGSFEPVARTEAFNNLPEQQVAELKRSLGNPDLWEISQYGGIVTFFLYTDRQVKQYEPGETKKQWADRYFDLVKPYDTFGYLSRDAFDICLDSKENFDKNYSSNWYYYYK